MRIGRLDIHIHWETTWKGHVSWFLRAYGPARAQIIGARLPLQSAVLIVAGGPLASLTLLLATGFLAYHFSVTPLWLLSCKTACGGLAVIELIHVMSSVIPWQPRPPRDYGALGSDGWVVLHLIREMRRQREQSDRFNKFTERARMALALAQHEALRVNHLFIDTTHILLGLTRVEGATATTILARLGLSTDDLRAMVEQGINKGSDGVDPATVALTSQAKRAIELAVDEARRFGHHYLGTEHLLLGLLAQGDDIAANVLKTSGVTLQSARDMTRCVLEAYN